MTRPRALTALTRFGLGPRQGDYAAASADPVGYVKDQCMTPEAVLMADRSLPTRDWLQDRYLDIQGRFRDSRIALRNNPEDAGVVAREVAMRKERQTFTRDIQNLEIKARFDQMVGSRTPFVERLVLFWSNHFAVERRRRGIPVRVTVGHYEREAIRPHVLGYFEDMLASVLTHPTMLQYLDNARNVGPSSLIGRRRGVTSVNENLAREVLELHTLGAGGGYSQDDVVALAETLSGWHGGFQNTAIGVSFDERFHEFGPRTILGKRYTSEGAEQLEEVLPDLASHPSTARFIAGKFARHFVSDNAPQQLVDDLENAFNATGGDLRELALVLLEHDAAWDEPAQKTVPPFDFMVAAARAMNATLPVGFVNRSARDLAHDIWSPPSPAGWSQVDDAFLGGDSLLERVDFARVLAQRFSNVGRPVDVAHELFGDALDPFVLEAVERAEHRVQALTLLLMSPAFHRR